MSRGVVLMKKHHPVLFGRFSCNAGRNFVRNTFLYELAVTVVPFGTQCVRITPSLSQNTATITFSQQRLTRNFFCGGESVCFHCEDWRFVSGLKNGIHVSSIVTTDEKKAPFMAASRVNIC